MTKVFEASEGQDEEEDDVKIISNGTLSFTHRINDLPEVHYHYFFIIIVRQYLFIIFDQEA